MKALVTGASSGIGREIAIYLSKKGYDLILVGRNKPSLEELRDKLDTNVKLVVVDLSDEKCIKELYMVTKNENIDLLVNNAGFGLYGKVKDTDLQTELDMINVNVKAVHILTKLFLKDFLKKDEGRILNVASVAGLLKGGPLLSTYYATKSYVVDFSSGLYEELRRDKSNVKISVLCPGPVDTNFNKTAGTTFAIKGLTPEYVAKYAIDQMLDKNKFLIIPSFWTRVGTRFINILPRKTALKIMYKIQKIKGK
jgi:Short-chain dehydrogenases of various substrate specificities